MDNLTKKNTQNMKVSNLKLKEYEVYKNGTQQGNIFAYDITDAEDIVFSTYGEHRLIQETVKYPFQEGDDYYTIKDGHIVRSCWDDVSEEIYDDNPNQNYYETYESALKSINN